MSSISSYTLLIAIVGVGITSNVNAHCVGSHSMKYGFPDCQNHDAIKKESIPIKTNWVAGAKEAGCSLLPIGTCEALDEKNWIYGASASISALLTGKCGTGAGKGAEQMAQLDPDSDCDKVVTEIKRRKLFYHVE